MAAAHSVPSRRQNVEEGNDLLEEILVRVPVRSLLRLKATCKRWRSLIESPSFIVFHRRRHFFDYHNRLVFSYGQFMYSLALSSEKHDDSGLIITPLFDLLWMPWLLFYQWPLHMLDPNPNPNPNPRSFQDCSLPYLVVLGPLNNGIYCIIHNDCQRQQHVSVGTSRIALCNLATREYKFIDPFPYKTIAFLFDLARDPSQVYYGFGSIENDAGIVVDYKVVVIILILPSLRFLSFVYSLKRRRWDKVADVMTYGVRINSLDNEDYKAAVAGLVNGKGEVQTPRHLHYGVVDRHQFFLKGSWHWLDVHFPVDERWRRGYKMNDRVLVFNLSDQVFGNIEGPPYDYVNPDDDLGRGLLLIDDHLAVIYIPSSPVQNKWSCYGFDLWVMMEYGIEESWTKIYSCKHAFNRSISFHNVIGVCYSTTASGGVRFGKIFLEDADTRQLCSWDGSQIRVHDFSFKGVSIFNWALYNTLGVSTYVDTLESLTLPTL